MLDFLADPVGSSLGEGFLVYHLLAIILIIWYCAYTGALFGSYLSTSVKDPVSRIWSLVQGGVGFRGKRAAKST